MTEAPVILIVGGGWHLPVCYDQLKYRLQDLGVECLVPQILTVGDNPGVTWAADVSMIHGIVTPLFERGKEVVIVGHSYGGIPACVATDAHGVEARRRRGQKGGFRAIIYIASFPIPQRGMDLLSFFRGTWPEWMITEDAYKPNSLITVTSAAKHLWYNDLPEDEAQKWFDLVQPHSQDSLETPVPFAATDINIPRYYLICELDAGVTTAMQEHMAASVPGMRVRRIQAGHSCFLSQPEKTAELIVEMTEEAEIWQQEIRPKPRGIKRLPPAADVPQLAV